MFARSRVGKDAHCDAKWKEFAVEALEAAVEENEKERHR
jgi:hypothetical protein